jgi:hypothetical protein
VPRCQRAGQVLAGWLDPLDKAEIGELGVSTPCDKYVGRLDISMENPGLVRTKHDSDFRGTKLLTDLDGHET